MVKSLKERLAEKRAAASDGEFDAPRPRPEPPKEETVIQSLAPNGATNVAAPSSEAITPERIKAIRKQHGMTQADLSRHLNVSTTTVAFWETNRSRPTKEFATELLNLEQAVPTATARDEKPEIDSGDERTTSSDRTEAGAKAAGDPEPKPAATREATVDHEPDPNKVIPAPANVDVSIAVLHDLQTKATATEDAIKSIRDRLDDLSSERVIPVANEDPKIRDNLDAFRLLVRTFGIETADQVVDLLRG